MENVFTVGDDAYSSKLLATFSDPAGVLEEVFSIDRWFAEFLAERAMGTNTDLRAMLRYWQGFRQTVVTEEEAVELSEEGYVVAPYGSASFVAFLEEE